VGELSRRPSPFGAVAPGMCIQEVHLGDQHWSEGGTGNFPMAPQPFAVTVLAVQDSVKAQYGTPGATLWGMPWDRALRSVRASSRSP
jgi:hypothetical protein